MILSFGGDISQGRDDTILKLLHEIIYQIIEYYIHSQFVVLVQQAQHKGRVLPTEQSELWKIPIRLSLFNDEGCKQKTEMYSRSLLLHSG